jgi:tetratricopeptide (TPR) repeat protein
MDISIQNFKVSILILAIYLSGLYMPTSSFSMDVCTEAIEIFSMYEREDYEGVIETGNRLLKLGLDDRSVYQTTALAYYKEKEYQKAIAWLKKAISSPYHCPGIKPKYNGLNDALDTAALYYNLSETSNLIGEEEESQKNYIKAVELFKGAFGKEYSDEKAQLYFNAVSLKGK